MERRNFFKIAPFGLAGIAALATNPLNAEPTGSSVLKAKQLTITGADGKQYHPLVVEAEATTHEEVPHQIQQPMMMSTERFRVTNNNSLGIGTTTPTMQFVYDGKETLRL
jgi:hypothetical protein